MDLSIISKEGTHGGGFISGSWLKLFACTVMLVDHCATFLYPVCPWMKEVLFDLMGKPVTWGFIMNAIGRMAFPIFAFLVTEGFAHTHDRKKYAANLFAFALISEIPWNLVHGGSLLFPRQNVFFTLLLGYLGIWALEYWRDDFKRMAGCLVGLFLISIFLRADYGCFGYGFILLLHLLRRNRLLMAIIGSCVLPSRWIGGLAFIPICLYNGRRGFATGKVAKYAFYIFYPLHLLILWWIRCHVA